MKKALLKLTEDCFRDASIADELCATSVIKYRGSIKVFADIVDCRNLEDLSNSDFDYFILKMKEKRVSNTRIANVISSLKWVLTKLERKGMVFNRLNLLTVRKPRIIKKETNYLTEKEIEQLINCIKQDMVKKETVINLRFMACITFLLQTGARIGEALSINISDIDRLNKEVRIIGKGRKPRTLFLRDETLFWIDKYLLTRKDDEKALFATQDGKSRWKQTDAGRSFRKYKKMSGIKKDFVIHTFRHTFATQYLMKGAGINVVQTALGHSEAVTTLKYYAAAVEKSKVREMINDKHFDFIPKSISYFNNHHTPSDPVH